MATRRKTTTRRRRKKKFNLKKFLKGDEFRKSVGLLFSLLGFFLLIALLSYLYTWQADQSIFIDRGISILFDSQVYAQNQLGRLGGYISHLLYFRLFGMPSLILVFLFFMLGLKYLIPSAKIEIGKLTRTALWFMLVLSVLFSFFFLDSPFPYGGNFGDSISGWLINFIGQVGTGIFLLFIIALSLMFGFKINPDINLPNWDYSFKLPTFLNFGGKMDEFITKIKSKFGDMSPQVANDSRITKAKRSGGAMELPYVSSPEKIQPKTTPITIDPKASITKKFDNNGEQLILDINTGGDIEEEDDDPNKKEDQLAEIHISDEDYDPKGDLSKYQMPAIELLELYGHELYDPELHEINRSELEKNKDLIVETLLDYKIEISSIVATVGPTITLYEIIPAKGVRISKIKNLADDIALSLAALGIRIIAPIPGKGTIGIEIPNKKREIVSLHSVIKAPKFANTKMQLPLALGHSVTNGFVVADLAKMPHLLIAGATGQGKSVCINSILISLIYKKHPAELKFVLVDPKMVELSIYSMIENHYLAKLPDEEEAIITDIPKVIHSLNALCVEMDARYNLLKSANVRNIRDYNRKFIKRKLNPLKGFRFLPYIVLVIDEYADLIMTAGKEIELPVTRLAQKARAIGIHLIVATQRPTVNIITGTIKANFPARIAFKVSSKIDSKTILDYMGAEQLIGYGDMLFSHGGDMMRLQGAFIDTPEVERVADFICQQPGYDDTFLLPENIEELGKVGGLSGTDGKLELDALFDDAARLVVVNQHGSTSLLQRRLKLGYNRAGRLMDQLEAAAIVGPNLGSKARDVLIPDEFELEKHLNALHGR